MAISGEEFLRYLIETGAFSAYNSQGLPAVDAAANAAKPADPLPVPLDPVPLAVTVEQIALHTYEVNNPVAAAVAPTAVSAPAQIAPVGSVTAQGNPYPEGSDGYYAYNDGWRPSHGCSAADFVFGVKPWINSKAAEWNIQPKDYDVPDAIADWIEAGKPGLNPTTVLTSTDFQPLGNIPSNYVPVNSSQVAEPTLIDQLLVSTVQTTGQFMAAVANPTQGSGVNLATAPTLNVLQNTGVITAEQRSQADTVINQTALAVSTAGLGTAASSVVKSSGPIAQQVVSSSVRTVVRSFIGKSGLQVNAYYAQSRGGATAKTWLNSAKTVEYCNVPAQGFKKSKFPDKFGNTCYFRKLS